VTARYRIALVGLGKIAGDQHRPAIAASSRFELVAAASPEGEAGGVPVFPDVQALLKSGIAVDALALCQPPQHRYAAAWAALQAGKHVLLEKPPGATTLEVDALSVAAKTAQKTLYCAWHSRHAPAVAPARAWLAGRRLRKISITWQEDVRYWHPGQQWIWEPGGMGVFDPGINALSIVTRLIDAPLQVVGGQLQVPRDCATPVAAQLALTTVDGVPVQADFDWLKAGAPIWDIDIDTDAGSLHLSQGGARLEIGGQTIDVGPEREYVGVYAEFAALIDAGHSDADTTPLRIVADAFMRCAPHQVAAFHR
jgi:D-galactose 1-dehydrogenase